MAFSGPFLLFYSPFVVAAIVLIWANIPRKNVEEVDEVDEVEEVEEVEEQNDLLDRIDMTMRKRSDVGLRKP